MKQYILKAYHVVKSLLPLITTGKSLTKLRKVFQNARARHDYISDHGQYNKKDYWAKSYRGDCEDFALMCYTDLRKAGICPLSLRITRCITERGVGHAVLEIKTSDGVYVADNRQRTLTKQEHLNYTWVSWFNFNV